MNVVEAYIKFKGQIIILVSGLSGSGKTELARDIERDFKLKMINLDNFHKKDYDKTVDIGDVKVVDWDNSESYDWNEFNKTVNENKSKGVVVAGPMFLPELIKFEPDSHIHVKIAKKNLLDKRHSYVDTHREKAPMLYELKNTDTETQIFNKITFPHYFEYREKSKINIFLNANEKTVDEMYDEAYDYLIDIINKYLSHQKGSQREHQKGSYNGSQKGFTEGKKQDRRPDKKPFTPKQQDKQPIRFPIVIPDDSDSSDDYKTIDDSSDASEKEDEGIYLGTTIDPN
jgi:cytidylate kinase